METYSVQNHCVL